MRFARPHLPELGEERSGDVGKGKGRAAKGGDLRKESKKQ